MASMNSVLRLRRVFRAVGADGEQADEAADAIDSHSYSRRESDLRFEYMMTEMRHQMAEIRNQFLFGVLIIVGVAVAILALVN